MVFLAPSMARTVFSYDLVRKDGEYGPLRVVGLAREAGHRTCKSHGLGSLRAEGIKHVWLSGRDLEHRTTVDAPWRNLSRGCHLRVRDSDEKAALSIVEADRAYIQHNTHSTASTHIPSISDTKTKRITTTVPTFHLCRFVRMSVDKHVQQQQRKYMSACLVQGILN